ncbi:hypothetical protein BDM02DRAFT_861292 [Thelephora ganbajun]|uniref:Uncharacterized protein n=1 Tax=Thelephora ganbajun TaxID=370292 RepID=A0ACB6ZP56_THEGA|nr:hypothetical protein BDM02DRAFT_861292 [Thelephora ganbajun]
MPSPDADEEFEFLVNLLASDGVGPDPLLGAASGGSPSRKGQGDRGFGIRRGSDGKLDLGRVKAFYESKNVVGSGRDGPWLTDNSRDHPGKGVDNVGLALEGDISVSRSASDREDEMVPPSSEHFEPAFHGADPLDDLQQGHAEASVSPPPIEDPRQWVDLLSEREAKQLLLEISGALKLKLPLDNDPGPVADRPRTLDEVKNVVEFLMKMDELVWRRSEYGADHGVFDSKNTSAVEERVRLWERIARGHCAE